MASKGKKSGSRSQSKFQAEYIDRRSTDELSPQIKGAAVWREENNSLGYWVWDKDDNQYIPIEYDEDLRTWNLIAFNRKENSWYTYKRAPAKYSLGPWRQNPSGIDIDSDEENTQVESDTNNQPAATTSTATVPFPSFTQAMATTTTSAAAATTITSGGGLPGGFPSSSGGGTSGGGGGASGGPPPAGGGAGGGAPPGGPPGGGGGPPGGGGGAPPPAGAAGAGGAGGAGGGGAPPPLNGKLGGNPPDIFEGDRTKSADFALQFELYRGMNPRVAQLAIPYQRSMTFLSYFRGEKVKNWVREQVAWLQDQIQNGVDIGEDNLWDTIKHRFDQAFTDTTETATARKNLYELKMSGGDVDTYIATFENLAKVAGFDLHAEATIDLFEKGLPFGLWEECLKRHHPQTWDDWKNAARLQQLEYMIIQHRRKAGARFGHSKGEWKKALDKNRHPDAMDVGRTQARATITEEERKRLQSEGRCFRCRKQGHISRNCPDRGTRVAETSTETPKKGLSASDRAEALIKQMQGETDEVRQSMVEKLFGKEKEGFPNA